MGKALHQVMPDKGIMDRLGNFQHKGYKIWPWSYNSGSAQLYNLKGDNMDVYKKMSGAVTRSTTHWELTHESQV